MPRQRRKISYEIKRLPEGADASLTIPAKSARPKAALTGKKLSL
jgi:hypothetical protein